MRQASGLIVSSGVPGQPSGAMSAHINDKSIHGVGELGHTRIYGSSFSTTTPLTWQDVTGSITTCNARGRPTLLLCNIQWAYVDAAGRSMALRFAYSGGPSDGQNVDPDATYWESNAVQGDRRGVHMMQRVDATSTPFNVKLQIFAQQNPCVATVFTGGSLFNKKVLIEALEI